MLKLTEEQARQLDLNLHCVISDLEDIMNGDEDQTFLTVGCKVGMALQRLYDLKTFVFDQTIKQAALKSSTEPTPEELKAMQELHKFNKNYYYS